MITILHHGRFYLSQEVAAYNALSTRHVEIHSEPPGARIEVSGNYIGDTPITTTLQCAPDGRFLEHTTIRALPTIPGQYVQSKFFDGGYQYYHQLNNSVPSRVFFDMRLGPVSPDINVNVQ